MKTFTLRISWRIFTQCFVIAAAFYCVSCSRAKLVERRELNGVIAEVRLYSPLSALENPAISVQIAKNGGDFRRVVIAEKNETASMRFLNGKTILVSNVQLTSDNAGEFVIIVNTEIENPRELFISEGLSFLPENLTGDQRSYDSLTITKLKSKTAKDVILLVCAAGEHGKTWPHVVALPGAVKVDFEFLEGGIVQVVPDWISGQNTSQFIFTFSDHRFESFDTR